MATTTCTFGITNEPIAKATKDGITYQIVEHKTEWVLKATIGIAMLDMKWSKKEYSSVNEFLLFLEAQGYKVEK